MDAATLGWAIGLGIGTFFSPCGWALIPAYVGFFAGTEDPGQGRWAGAGRGVRFGLAASLGILVVLGTAAALVGLVLRQAGVSSALLGEASVAVGVAVGLAVIGLGGLMLTDRAPTLTLPVTAPREKTVAGMVGFGVLFALGSIGCTLPVFVGFVSAVVLTAASPFAAAAAVLVFAGTVAGLMVLMSLALAVAKEQVQARVRRIMPYVEPASGLLLVAAGVYVLVYYLVYLPS